MSSKPLDVIDHCAVRVNDLENAIHWYTTSFCCELVYRDRTQAVLQFANVKLSLVLPSQEPAHVAYVKTDASTLGELRTKPDGSRSTFVSDPSGNPVELLAPGAAEPAASESSSE